MYINKSALFGFQRLLNEIHAAATATEANELVWEIPLSELLNIIRISLRRGFLRFKWERVLIFVNELNACRGKDVFKSSFTHLIGHKII